MINGKLTIWTIFHRPDDLPEIPYVVKCSEVRYDRYLDNGERWFCETLDAARALIRRNDPTADYRMARHRDDVASIVECWL